MSAAAERVAAFPKVRALCLGDIMVDRYVYGSVSRISAEAPVLIMKHQNESIALGAVGNVGRNIAALGGQATIVSLVGDDFAAGEIERLIAEEPRLEGRLIRVPERRTTVKTRFIARGKQLLRTDVEEVSSPGPEAEARILEAFRDALPQADVVVLSDYSKGCLSETVLRGAIDAAREAGKPVVADPKHGFRRYAGVTLIKPNAREIEQSSGIPCTDNEATVASARSVMERVAVDAVLVTRSERGMTLVPRDGEVAHFRERAIEVFDVTGAGDTALAVLALALGGGASLAEASSLANKTCSIVVSKIGTAVVHARELLHSLHAEEYETAAGKLGSLPMVAERVERWRTQGARIGFTNGCFDVVHAGHVSLLEQAARTCDRLVVGLNSDASVRRLKGDGRPIHDEAARATVLASVGVVDAVVIFDEDTPLHVIESLRPDVLIKGADYQEDQVVGATFVRSYGGEILLARLEPGAGTTRTIEAIRARS